ncbi:hypothetical protein ACFVW9_37455 [Streptomyces sp. NPDC058217]
MRHGIRQLAEAVRGDHVELVRERQRDLLRGGDVGCPLLGGMPPKAIR